MIILGLNYVFHEASAALIVNGRIIVAAEEERFSRVKFDNRFPKQAANYCLREADLKGRDLDIVAFSWNPSYLPIGDPRFRANLRSRIYGELRGLRSFTRPIQRHAYLRFRVPAHIRKELGPGKYRIHFVQHHMAHAASAFLVSGFDKAVVLTVDGHGEWEGTTIAAGQGNEIRPLRKVYSPHSLGFLYAAATRYLGFEPFSDEYKVMGLAAFGKPSGRLNDLVRLDPDGSYRFDLSYFSLDGDFITGFSEKFVDRFGPPRDPDGEVSDRHNQIAADIQDLFVRAYCHLGRWARRKTGFENVVVAGGCGLNGPANYALINDVGFKDIFVQPAASDSGTSLGAALATWMEKDGDSPNFTQSPYLGPAFSEEYIAQKLMTYKLGFTKPANFARAVADLLKQGYIVAHFNGRMEWGPRALGNRSILADPRCASMKDRVNSAVKFREAFRPFAPAVKAESSPDFFEMRISQSPYMTLVVPARSNGISSIPAVVHVDGTCRVQTLRQEQNPPFYEILDEFEKLTGVPILLNTSFNVKGEPIVCTPDDAIRCFFTTGLDFLAIDPFIVGKKEALLP